MRRPSEALTKKQPLTTVGDMNHCTVVSRNSGLTSPAIAHPEAVPLGLGRSKANGRGSSLGCHGWKYILDLCRLLNLNMENMKMVIRVGHIYFDYF